MIRLLVSLTFCVLVALAYKAWFGDVGYFAVEKMAAKLADQQSATQAIAAENQELRQEVIGLQHERLAVESRARTDLGMIREGESFFLVVDAD